MCSKTVTLSPWAFVMSLITEVKPGLLQMLGDLRPKIAYKMGDSNSFCVKSS